MSELETLRDADILAIGSPAEVRFAAGDGTPGSVTFEETDAYYSWTGTLAVPAEEARLTIAGKNLAHFLRRTGGLTAGNYKIHKTN